MDKSTIYLELAVVYSLPRMWAELEQILKETP